MEINPDRDEELADIVDELTQGVIEERQAHGVPGNAAERERTVPRGDEDEPPD